MLKNKHFRSENCIISTVVEGLQFVIVTIEVIVLKRVYSYKHLQDIKSSCWLSHILFDCLDELLLPAVCCVSVSLSHLRCVTDKHRSCLIREVIKVAQHRLHK